jgi:hypothetical protein
MMSFAAAGTAGSARLRTAQILSTRQFVWRVINHFIWLQLRGGVGPHPGDLRGKKQQEENENCLQDKRCAHAAAVETAERCFSRQARS